MYIEYEQCPCCGFMTVRETLLSTVTGNCEECDYTAACEAADEAARGGYN